MRSGGECRRRRIFRIAREKGATRGGVDHDRQLSDLGLYVSGWSFPSIHPVLPMLAQRVSALPEAGDYVFEPKWDGFRTLSFGTATRMLAKPHEKPLNRYFPGSSGRSMRGFRAAWCSTAS